MTDSTASDCKVLTGTFFRERTQRVRFTKKPPAKDAEPVRRPAHVARMVALAHHLQAAIDRGVVADRAAVARKLGLTRGRITQLLDLTLLAPDLALQVLELEAVDGAEPLAERELRQVIHAGCWAQQRKAWAGVRRGRGVRAVGSVKMRRERQRAPART